MGMSDIVDGEMTFGPEDIIIRTGRANPKGTFMQIIHVPSGTSIRIDRIGNRDPAEVQEDLHRMLIEKLRKGE